MCGAPSRLWRRLPSVCSARRRLTAVRVRLGVFQACTKLPSASHQSWFSLEKTNFDATLVRVWIDARFCAYHASGSRGSRAMLHDGRACCLHLGLIGPLRLSVPPGWGSTPFPHFCREYASPTFRRRIITPPSLRRLCACTVLHGSQPFNPPLCSTFYWSANYNSSHSFSALLLIIKGPIFGARQRKLVHGKYHRHSHWAMLPIFSGQKNLEKWNYQSSTPYICHR